MRSIVNPFANPDMAAGYEVWYQSTGRRAGRLEKVLLKRLLARFPQAGTLLEVGCGTGHFTRWFGEQGLQPAGLDRSLPMLAESVRLNSPPCVRGDALALPFSSGAFDLVALIMTLEFVADPAKALAEALRVSRQGLLLGALNRQSSLARRLEREGGPIWGVAHFYTTAELVHVVRRAAVGKQAQILWRTTLWPLWPRALPLPWGGFIGMAVTHPERGGKGA
jgi:ubiquinone/menaquinone biosynthesis C-methylase UbiE